MYVGSVVVEVPDQVRDGAAMADVARPGDAGRVPYLQAICNNNL